METVSFFMVVIFLLVGFLRRLSGERIWRHGHGRQNQRGLCLRGDRRILSAEDLGGAS
jgi:hypothetical protein